MPVGSVLPAVASNLTGVPTANELLSPTTTGVAGTYGNVTAPPVEDNKTPRVDKLEESQ